ncbi:flagellar export chaperone FliS [Paenarthrobacter sp. Z7-10]|uniref:flagellar export chaperone FliS n=1 Tax=Paenarthrobacter sp. Z7-10 TaxID=2787635 RepID=UPI0022A96B10|nr:flagellar export chaperone FliS [Paenarthrobacter sp. Z7-10]MCZ2403325.1 flagellar export chaperone FliS [Paenarthrobacter sp. Z7-10]
MTMMYGAKAQLSQYNREAALSAPPARLLTMLYDRLLLDLNRAELAQQGRQWDVASENLIHAQAIVAELASSLNVDAWDGAEGLLGLYNYASSALIDANIHRDAVKTRDCIALLEPLRASWHEAAALIPAALPAVAPAAERVGGMLGVG